MRRNELFVVVECRHMNKIHDLEFKKKQREL